MKDIVQFEQPGVRFRVPFSITTEAGSVYGILYLSQAPEDMSEDRTIGWVYGNLALAARLEAVVLAQAPTLKALCRRLGDE